MTPMRTGGGTLFLLAFIALGPDPAEAQEAPADLPAGTRILVRTTNGKFLDAKLVEARPDSVLLRKGRRDIALPAGAVEGVWTFRRDLLGGFKAGATYGALVGVMDGFAVPTECFSCDEERGSSQVVLTKMLVSAGIYGLVGLVSGHFDGAWTPHRGFGDTPATPTGGPFPLWSLAVSLGRTYSFDRTDAYTSMAIAGYRNGNPGSSLGFETGLLRFPKEYTGGFELRSMYYDSTGYVLDPNPVGRIDYRSESALTYGTLFIARLRGSSGAVRTQFLIGPSVYGRWSTFYSETRDSTGVLAYTQTSSGVEGSFGLMTGFGATYGQGAFRPALRGRGHWILSDYETFLVTVEAGVDFH